MRKEKRKNRNTKTEKLQLNQEAAKMA